MADVVDKPNIIVIVSDDCGYNEYSLNGSKLFTTPNIDSIAKNGVHFKTGYTSGTVCSPTRAGLLTGRYQNRFGHEFNVPPMMSETNGLPLTETTMADVLKSTGYRTIAIGKWHLGYAPKFHPLERGFTDYYGFLQGSRSYFPLPKPSKLNQLLRDREPVKESFEYMTDELGRAACEYIVKHREKPFYMYVAYNGTHAPNHTLESDVKSLPNQQGNVKHRAMTAALDRSIGTILKELDQQKLTDNTLVIFTNDNGGATGHDNTPWRGHKGTVWEGGIRVPFAMKWPKGLPKGKVIENPVMTLDIFPTVIAAAGIEKSPGKTLDGVNLLPFARGDMKGRPHTSLYWKSGSEWAIRDGDMKLLISDKTVGKEAELYDLLKDPSESTNLVKEHGEKARELRAKWEAWNKLNIKPLWGKVDE